MEAAAGVAAARSVSLPMPPSQPSRQEWRVVSDHPVRNGGSEELERLKVGQSDERTIYEVQQGREPDDVDFCSIAIDGSLNNDILEQRLLSVERQREEMQEMEIDLRTQIIARSAITEMQNGFDAQMKEHAIANVKLKDQLHEMEQTIHELERKMAEKERELHAIKLDNEAAWAKEDLLREQSKELQTFRRDRDNTDAERAQLLNQMHDLQEHIQDKERQLLELQEQNRVAQETVLVKDEQLREAHAWITRVQEMDGLQSTTNHSLHAELRERTEQYNQLWLFCQQQFAEMERLHFHTIQQLQLELADARDRSGTYVDESRVSQTSSDDASQFRQNGNQLDVNGNVTTSENSGVLPNGNAENLASFISNGNASAQADHVHGVPIAPSSVFGMPTYLTPEQVTALRPFVMHQQGAPHSVPPHVTQSPVGHFHSVGAILSLEHSQNQQAASEGLQVPTHNLYPPSQTDQNVLRSDTNYDYKASVNGQAIHPDYLDGCVSQVMEPNTMISASAAEGQVLEQADKSYVVAPQPQQSLQHISSYFHDALRLDSLPQNSETREKAISTSTNHGLEVQGFATEQASSPANTPSSETPITRLNFSEATMNNAAGAVSSDHIRTGGKTSETALLDERSLLACIVRTIPPGSGGRIRISSTLPTRLGKMLAPLHWLDYKKKYGKLDDFVGGHPDLFVIEGDYIQLREGAQENIAASAAVAKVAAAAKTASSPYSSLLPSVAVTPMAQSHHLKRGTSIDSKHSDGICVIDGGISNVKISGKPKDPLGLNGTESRPRHSSGPTIVGNGANPNRSGLVNSLSKGSNHGTNSVVKPKGRTSGAAFTSRR